ncbi:MAG: peptidylprolyl isomerase [Candidatus Krumholzibacteria bacterium]|nr:peptidylprolyl isomerase [Candidatus Krumholzibacteria bacterium]
MRSSWTVSKWTERIGLCFLVVTIMLCAGSGAIAGPALQDETAEVEEVAVVEDGPVRIAITLEKGGVIVMEMLSDEAPITVERVLTLVREGFYDGLKFHRVEGFLVQTGKKEHEYSQIEGEMFGQDLRHEAGMVGMARFPRSYDSASTQFYIMKKYKVNFNGEYTIFAKVVEGMEVVDSIKKNDKIDSIVIVE